MENNEDAEVNRNRTIPNKDSRPKASIEDNATTDQEREIDIIDCDASEGVEVKQVGTGIQADPEKTEDTRKRNLKEIPMNDQIYSLCNQCYYRTGRDDKVIDHLQDYCDESKRNYNNETDQTGCQPLIPKNPRQKNVEKDSGIEGSKVLENNPDTKAAGAEFNWTIRQESNEGNP